MAKLRNADFAAYIAAAKEKISAYFELTKEKPINFGYQLVLEFCGAKATVNIYNGKKGLTLVYGGDSVLQQKLKVTVTSIIKAIIAAIANLNSKRMVI